MLSPQAHRSSWDKALFWTFVLTGFAAHVVAACKTWIGGDQAHLLRLGAAFATNGEIIPFGKLLSGGGTNPGILLQLLFGIPMLIVEHFRSPMVLVIISHTVAFILIARILQNAFGNTILLPLALAYWLTPWRIYYGSLLWEPAFIYLPAALHLWGCYKLRLEKSFIGSAACIASTIWAMQIHNSFVIIALATVVLLWKKHIHLDWRGGIVGLLVGGATLIPTILAIITDDLPYHAQESEGYIGKGLVTFAPMLKGMLYWFNLGGVEAVRNLKETRFEGSLGIYILQGICIATVIVSIIATWWYFRPLWKGKGIVPDNQTTFDRQWMRFYCLTILLTLIVAAGLSPITLQGWMVVIALHAACIPMCAWFVDRLSNSRRSKIALPLYAAFEVLVIIVIISGQSIFNRQTKLPSDIDPQKDTLLIKYIPSNY